MANSYATVADFRAHWGAARTAALVDGSATTQNTVIGAALDAAASQIEASAIEGGYAVPVVPADLESDAGRQIQIGNLLRLKTIVIATIVYMQPIDATPQVRNAQQQCEKWLEGLEDGKGLGVSPPSGTGGFSWIGMSGATDNLTQRNLIAGRRVGL